MQKLLLFPVFFIFCINILSAQTNFVDGGIIQANGDTVKGQIDYQEWTFNPSKISFRKTGAFGAKIYDAQNIAGFYVTDKNEIYQSAVVDLNMEPSTLKEMLIFRTKKEAYAGYKPVKDSVFLFVLARGEMNLFEYIDNNRSHYLVQKGNEPIKELVFRQVKIDEASATDVGILYLYRDQLRVLTGDCKDLKLNLNTLEYNKSSMESMIRKYNKCHNNIIYTRLKEKSEKWMTAYLGVGAPLLFADIGEPLVSYSNGYGGLTPLIGAEFGINAARLRGKQGFGLGLRASKFSKTFHQNTATTHFADLSYFRLYGFYRQGMTDGNIKSFLKVGGGGSHFFKAKYSASQYYALYDKTVNYPKQLNHNSFNLFAGIGLQIKQISVEIQYEVNSTLSFFNATERVKANQISLLAGYKFFSKTR
jgi:hypothetical protein